MVLSIGTPNSDTNANLVLPPGNGDDEIYGRGRSDNLQGLGGNDRMYGDRKPPGFPVFPLELAGNDTLDGGAGNDLLYGDPGNDSLIGGIGNDFLDGGTGNDTMNGGLGNDVYFVDSVNDVAAESAGGVDLVFASVSHTLSTNLENLWLTGANPINGTGNFRGNIITGNNNANQLNGLDGNDTLNGNGGNDFLLGGNGDDVLVGGGDGEIDVLTSGSPLDRDTFVLGTGGTSGQVLYDRLGNSDFARITDFDIADFLGGPEPLTQIDRIQLRGTSGNYRLANNVNLGGATGVGIYDRNALANPFDDDLIGLVQGVTAGLAINQLNLANGNQFVYV